MHADDVVELFVASLTSHKAAGKCLLTVAGRMSWEQVQDIVKVEFPDRPSPPTKADAPTMVYSGADVIEFDTAVLGTL